MFLFQYWCVNDTTINTMQVDNDGIYVILKSIQVHFKPGNKTIIKQQTTPFKWQ